MMITKGNILILTCLMMIIKKNILILTSHLFPDVRVREDGAALARLHKKVEEGKSLLFADCCLGGTVEAVVVSKKSQWWKDICVFFS